ncbi:hypothetical protein REPUB_Repub18cG0168500 [Reevesia pubescens]
MKIAVEGCMHGDLDKVYETIKFIETTRNIKIDLLLCCGDFQAVRNEKDMESLSVPPKYREMKSFWKYYSGQEVAPVPTIFIGGNHEASNYFWELYYGGWAAPNIYFLGLAGVIKFGNIRIGGLSGIYNARHYHLGHHERPPYNDSTIRSVYHVPHLHCKFTAIVQHKEAGPVTKFLALDKCLPGHKFLQIVDIESDPGPYEIQYDEEWLAITQKFNCVFPLTIKRGNFGSTQLGMQECRQWARSRLEDRGAKPFYPCNPQTVSFLEFLDLPYVLDNASESRDGPASLTQRGDSIIPVGSLDGYSEDMPIEDEDGVDDVAEALVSPMKRLTSAKTDGYLLIVGGGWGSHYVAIQ